MRNARRGAATACVVAMAVAAQAEPRGRIDGVVRFEGEAELPPLRVTRDSEVCGAEVTNDALRVGRDGVLADVAVWLATVPVDPDVDRSRRIPLRVEGCRLRPHAIAMSVGQVLDLTNGDPLPHRLQAFLEREETLFQLSLPIQNQVISKRMKRPGIVHVRCDDGHAWAAAVVVVQPHAFVTLSGADGTFRLNGVPPGTHQIVAWHERLGERRVTVQVPAGGSVRTDLLFRRR